MYNLLNESWIPVLDRDGAIHTISCAQIVNNHWVDLAPVRHDFRGALYEFLIGLLQTVATPEDDHAWEDWMLKPPTAEELNTRFEQIESAFNLDGDGFRFLQDSSLELTGEKRIEQLLLDAPAGNTLTTNKDHFQKRSKNETYFSYPSIAMALITRALYDPGFGGGFYGALRGPGALVTLVKRKESEEPSSLWETLWLNVVAQSRFPQSESVLKLPAQNSVEFSKLFRWMTSCETSAKKKPGVLSGDVHPFAVFWGAPNRVRIEFVEGLDLKCSLTGEPIQKGATSLTSQQHGTNYEGQFFHPLSPCFNNPTKPEKFKFSKGKYLSGRGASFRSWMGVGLPDSTFLKVADVVAESRMEIRKDYSAKVWCFGFDLDKAKAKAWYEYEFPKLNIGLERIPAVSKFVEEFIAAADVAVNNLRYAIQHTLYEEYDVNKKGPNKWSSTGPNFFGKTFWEETELNYWQGLDPSFYDLVEKFIKENDLEEIQKLRVRWLSCLKKNTLLEFDKLILSVEGGSHDPKSTALARNELKFFTSVYNSKIQKALHLEKPKKKKNK